MKIQFNRKFAALLSLVTLLPTLAYLVKDNYKVAIITKDSATQYQMWELGLVEAVKLETIDSQVIGLSHWSIEHLEDTDNQFFFEPQSVDKIFSCYPELLDSEIQEKHMFGKESGVMFTGKFGRLVVFSSGVL